MKNIIQDHNRFRFDEQIQSQKMPYFLTVIVIETSISQQLTWGANEAIFATIGNFLKKCQAKKQIEAFCFIEPNSYYFLATAHQHKNQYQLMTELKKQQFQQVYSLRGGYMEIATHLAYEAFMQYSRHVDLPLLVLGQSETKAIDEQVFCCQQLVEEIVSGKFTSFSLVYQPKLHVESQQFSGCEVLCRWEHPKYQKLAPEIFLPVVQKLEQQLAFDCFIFEQLCQFICEHDQTNKVAKYSFNISAHSVSRAEITPALLAIAQRFGVAPQRIMIELLEEISHVAYEDILKQIQQLSNAGFQLSIDDFGTGYSSYYRLSELQFSEVKIPREFLLQNTDQQKKIKIIGGIIGLGKSLACDIVVEGVETAEDCQFLAAFPIDFMQGYYFARPMTAQKFIHFLQQTR